MSENEKNLSEKDLAEAEREGADEIKDEAFLVEEDTENSELHRIMYGGEYSEYGEELGEEEQPMPGRLSTFAVKKEEVKKPLKTNTQKRITLIAVISSVLVAVIALVLIFAPDLFGGEEPVVIPELYGTEVLSGSNRVLMYEHIERSNIQRIEVTNSHGSYVAYYNAEMSAEEGKEVFCYEGLELAPYDQELFSQLVVSTGYTVVSDRFLPEDENRAPLSEYGLDEASSPARFTITTREGKSHTVLIGKPTLQEDYYYCMYEGRDIVYILEQSISTTLLADVRSLITPILTYPISDNSYLTNIPKVVIAKDGNLHVEIVYRDDEANKDTDFNYGVTVPYVMVKPYEYDVSTQQMQTILSGIVNMTGTELLEYGIFETVLLFDENGEPILDEDGKQDYEYVLKKDAAEKYSLLDPAYDIYYQYLAKGDDGEDISIDTWLTISPKITDDDGTEYYYVASMMYDFIARVDAEPLKFLEWDTVDYLDKPVFNMHIDKVDIIEVKTGDKHFTFKLTGTGGELTVVEKTFKPGTVYQTEQEVRIVRKFYQTLLSINREDFIEEPEEGGRALIAELIVTTREGEVKHYRFYAYSERRCFFTINDKGEFYVKRTMVEKMLRDAEKVINKEMVDPQEPV